MRPWNRLLFPDANKIRRRAPNSISQVRVLLASMEGKLTITTAFLLLMLSLVILVAIRTYFAAKAAIFGRVYEQDTPFTIVLFMCVWKRPILTDFVLSHYHSLIKPLAVDNIHLHIFLVGSDPSETSAHARKLQARFVIHPNNPLGAKHDLGLQSLRDVYTAALKENQIPHLPDAVAIVGSDDVLNQPFFVAVRSLMSGSPPVQHVVGLKDIYFFDLRSLRLVYTPGYRSYETPISGTIGCGRVFSWAMLETLDWHLWDVERERGLDQSAIRNVMTRVPMVGDVSEAVNGRAQGIVAVDIKSDGYGAGVNIWRFEQVVQAVGSKGRLHEFEDMDARETLGKAFGGDFLHRLEGLRAEMAEMESE